MPQHKYFHVIYGNKLKRHKRIMPLKTPENLQGLFILFLAVIVAAVVIIVVVSGFSEESSSVVIV